MRIYLLEYEELILYYLVCYIVRVLSKLYNYFYFRVNIFIFYLFKVFDYFVGLIKIVLVSYLFK